MEGGENLFTDLLALCENDEKSQVSLEPLPSSALTDIDPMFPSVDDVFPMKTEWQLKHPLYWKNEDVLDWIFMDVAVRNNVDLRTFSGESLQGLTGQNLYTFTRLDFAMLNADHGQLFYNRFNELLRQYPYIPAASSTLPSIGSFIDPLSFDITSGYGSGTLDDLVNLELELPTIDEKTFLDDPGYVSGNSSPIDDGMDSTFSDFDYDPYRHPSPLTPCSSDDSSSKFGLCTISSPGTNSRKAGRPRKPRCPSESSSSDGEPSQPAPRNRRRRENRSKIPHLWKFMRALLEDSTYNPDFIKWENKDEGVFRIVPGQSKHIARLWGIKKNNPTMTFDKLSRALRWCRTYGFLSEVPKNRNYPKKLCFRFAPYAMNWQPDNTVLV